MSEGDLVRAVIDGVNATRKAFVWRHQSGRVKVKGAWMTLAPKGAPDIVGFTLDRGIFIGIEVKLVGLKPTAIQETWREFIAKAGGISVVVSSVTEAIAAVMHPQTRNERK